MEDYEPKETLGVFSFVGLYLLFWAIGMFFSALATGDTNPSECGIISLLVVLGLDFGRRRKYRAWARANKRSKQR